MQKRGLVLALVAPLLFGGCSRDDDASKPAVATPSAAPVKSVSRPKGRNWPMPSGPVLAMLAGEGVGPIRIGATVATIQRLMELPCEVKTADACRYIGRAVEFELEHGVTKRVKVHRAGRAAGKDATGAEREYGFFNGAIPPDLRFGMVPAAIQEYLGRAERVETLEAAPPNFTVERHHYRGMVVEYDRHSNGNLIMGGVVIEKPSGEATTPAVAASAKAP